MARAPAFPILAPLTLLILSALASAAACAQSRETAAAQPYSSAASRPVVQTREQAPVANRLQRIEPLAARNAGEKDGVNQAIDRTLGKFAAGNAGNPQAQAALLEAAAQVNRDPSAFVDAAGAPNKAALNALVAEKFSGVGNVTVPSLTTNGDTPYPNLGSMGDGDIEAMCFIVLMEAAKSAQDDLKSIMAGVKAINKQKEGLRHTSDTINQLSANCGDTQGDCPVDDGALATVNGVLAHGDADPVGKKDIDNAKDTVKNKLDSLSEMGEMESLRLQMAMDRLSKLMSTLSNVLKKSSDTASDITGNIK